MGSGYVMSVAPLAADGVVGQSSIVTPNNAVGVFSSLFGVLSNPNTVNGLTQLGQAGLQGITSFRQGKAIRGTGNAYDGNPYDQEEERLAVRLIKCREAVDGLCCFMPNFCHENATCSSDLDFGKVDLPSILGSVPRCNCQPGLIGDGRRRGTGCKNVDECTSGASRCSQICTDLVPGYACGCSEGFELEADLASCRDVDECVVGTHECSQLCINLLGTYECDCEDGWEVDPDNKYNCVDINECNWDPCGDGLCENTDGTYICICTEGYEFIEGRCQDVDECSLNMCPGESTCLNTEGGFNCECPSGFELSIEGCIDIDECLSGPCVAPAICENTNGAFRCSCEHLHTTADVSFLARRDPTRSPFWKGFQATSRGCERTQVCQAFSCPVNSFCGDEIIGEQVLSYCGCAPGFEWSASSGGSCVDVDECETTAPLLPGQAEVWGTSEGGPGGCAVECLNQEASFSCSCPPGYNWNKSEMRCLDVDECLGDPCLGGCMNTEGGHHCLCAVGWATYAWIADGFDHSVYPAPLFHEELVNRPCAPVTLCELKVKDGSPLGDALCGSEASCRDNGETFECICPQNKIAKSNGLLPFGLFDDEKFIDKLGETALETFRCYEVDECKLRRGDDPICPELRPCCQNTKSSFKCGRRKGRGDDQRCSEDQVDLWS